MSLQLSETDCPTDDLIRFYKSGLQQAADVAHC